MASGGGGTAAAAVATEKLIRSAQKSTNQLKALLAGGGGGRSSGAVEVILSDISDSLSQALASLVLHAASDDRLLPAAAPPEVSLLPSYGQSVVNSGGRSVSKRKAQRRSRADGSSRRIILERGDPDDSYPWRKYGQKDILGARFARSYYRCAQMLGCSARKHVQQSDDDPSRLEITYIGAHTCGGDRPSATAISLVDDKRCNTATSHMPVAAAVPSALQKLEEQHVPASSDDMMMACAHTCGGDRPSSPATNPVDGTRCDAATSHRLLPSALQKLDEHVVTSSDDMMVACTPSMAASSWLFIPTPACSQSELLSEAEVPKLRVRQEQDASPDDPVEVEEHKKPCDADHESLPLHDSVVPDFL